MINWLKLWVLVLIAISNMMLVVLAESKDGQSVYVAPELIKRGPPTYPLSMLEQALAGMVEVEVMVDKDGKVFEPSVIDSSNPEFEQAALNAVAEYSYKPATLNGQPVESRVGIRIIFMIEGMDDVVGEEFARKYRRVRKLLAKDKPNQERIEKRLNVLDQEYGLSLYGLAHLNLAKSIYASRYSDEKNQLQAYRKMLLFEGRAGKNGKFLDEETQRTVYSQILNLQINLGRYGDALDTYQILKKSFPQRAKKVSQVIAEVQALVSGDNPFSSKLTLDHNGHQLTRLSKNIFTIPNVSTEITALKVRCDRKFAKLEFQTASEYAIPKSWGECYIEIIGEPNLAIDLVQF